MTYSLSNKCGKDCCKWTFVHIIVKDEVICFLRHSTVL